MQWPSTGPLSSDGFTCCLDTFPHYKIQQLTEGKRQASGQVILRIAVPKDNHWAALLLTLLLRNPYTLPDLKVAAAIFTGRNDLFHATFRKTPRRGHQMTAWPATTGNHKGDHGCLCNTRQWQYYNTAQVSSQTYTNCNKLATSIITGQSKCNPPWIFTNQADSTSS